MKRIVFPLIMLLVCALSMRAYDEDKLKGYELNLSGGIYLTPVSPSAWTLEPEMVWRFHRYLGLSIGMEITRQYNGPSRSTTIEGHMAELCSNERDIGWIIFKPGLVLRSPNLWSNSKEEKCLWVEVSGGVSLGCPFRNSLTYQIKEFEGVIAHTIGYKTFPNKDLRWLYFFGKIQLKFSVERLIFGLGYSLSDLDYYSCRRNVTLENGNKFRVPKKQMSQSAFLTIGYKF